MRPSQKVETFPDGITDIYEEDEGRKLGSYKGSFRFEKKSVGVTRFYQSQVSVSSNRIDRMIKVPHNNIVDRMDIAVMKTEDNRQYRIIRIQEKPENGVDLWELEAVQVALKSGGGTSI
ncbi:MAG: hypothetical protein K6F73_07455 [Lachnospiraceae bacterium]|nr:hypothetical protein [Lachnospiraceae bacterium]